jgi:uncharacterized membrane protein
MGAVIVSGAIVSVALIVIQPAAVGAWCSLCLCSAALSLAIFVLGMEEPLAGVRHLARVRASGGSVWSALWGRPPRRRALASE